MARVRLAKTSVELVPVVEVYGFTYSNLPRPEGASAWERPELWDAYFQRCMADAGFGEVRTIAPAVSFVAVHDLLGSPLLERLIRDQLDSSKADRPSEEKAAASISALMGGLALFVDGELLITPSCCGDLGDLSAWEEAVTTRPQEGTLWIGHPDLKVSFTERLVTLRETWETPIEPDHLVEVTVPNDQLAVAVAAARAALTRFGVEMTPTVARVLGSPEPAAEIANLLIGVEAEAQQ